MASSVKSLRMLSFGHVAFGILAITTGLASMSVTDYYSGVFGMGIWLGSWIFLTGLAGMASSVKPGNYCRIGIFLGCCLVAIVILSICSIIIGTVVIKHFRFESTVTRDYYKNKGVFGEESHADYFKPDQYFDDRHKAGIVGLAVYSCLLIIIISDVLLSSVSVYVCRDLTLGHGQAATARTGNRRPSSTRRGQSNTVPVPIGEPGLGGQNWAELVFQGMPGTIQPIHYIQNPELQFYTPYKLPNYAELYPEGIPNSAVVLNEEGPVTTVPDEPPPAYTPTANTSLPQQSSLPGSSVVVPLNSHSSPNDEQSIVQESTTSARALTPSTERTRSLELPEASNLSSQHPGMLDLSSEYTESSTPVQALYPGDSDYTRIPVNSTPSSLETSLNSVTTTAQVTPLPNALIMSTNLSTREFQNFAESDLSGSLPNSVEDTPEDSEENTNIETASKTAASVVTETR